MDDPRYPVGKLEPVGRALTGDERAALIDTIEAHPANMRAAVAELDDAQLDTPYREGGWTARQVVHHVVDSHVNAYVRFKLAVAQDGATVGTYDETRWAELPRRARGAGGGVARDPRRAARALGLLPPGPLGRAVPS